MWLFGNCSEVNAAIVLTKAKRLVVTNSLNICLETSVTQELGRCKDIYRHYLCLEVGVGLDGVLVVLQC